MIDYFGFDSRFIDNENIISKLNLLLQLERMDPYLNDSTLKERIKIALQYVKGEYRQYVLALFANTIYFPNTFSKSVLQHLLNSLLFRYGIRWETLGKRCLILEQDPTGIVNDFLRTNHIHGRLDKQTFQRTQQVKTFVEIAINNNNGNMQIENVSEFLNREYWIVLVDNSLSGTSLISDLHRLIDLANMIDNTPKKIILLIRTLAGMAYSEIKKSFAKEINECFIEVNYGLLLDKRFIINSNSGHWKECIFFNDEETYAGVGEACRWLTSQPEYVNDPLLNSQKKNSIGDEQMTFGFKGCGITFVSSENCPSDSLPLLWYENDRLYKSPFPRVISRIGG